MTAALIVLALLVFYGCISAMTVALIGRLQAPPDHRHPVMSPKDHR